MSEAVKHRMIESISWRDVRRGERNSCLDWCSVGCAGPPVFTLHTYLHFAAVWLLVLFFFFFFAFFFSFLVEIVKAPATSPFGSRLSQDVTSLTPVDVDDVTYMRATFDSSVEYSIIH